MDEYAMMLLHLGFAQQRFYLWVETPCLGEETKHPRKGEPHPFPFAALPKVYPNEEVLGFKPHKSAFQNMVLWSLGAGGHAFPSSPLIAPDPSSRAAPELLPWQVTALALEPQTAINFLARASGQHMLAEAVVVAPDLTFATHLLSLAGSMVANQHYLPGLTEGADGWFARWLAVFGGDEQALLTKLLPRMPASLRALCPGAAAAPETPAQVALESMVGVLLDQLVRGQNPRQPIRAFESIHDHWLHALQTADGRMSESASTIAELDRVARQWRAPIELAAKAPVRLCFRLEEPEVPVNYDQGEASEPGLFQHWYVRYLLQPHEDPSLLISAEDVWHNKPLPKFGSSETHLREYLLSLLGQAAAVCEGVSKSLDEKTPLGYQLDTDGAFVFLSQQAAMLKQLGYAVLLPVWWTRRGPRRLGVKGKVSAATFQAGSKFTLDTVINFSPSLALDGETLSDEELQMLAGMKSALVKLRGQWVEIGDKEIRAALNFWQNKQQRQLTVGELIRLKLGAQPAEEGLTLNGVEAEGWLADLLDQLERRTDWLPLPQPANFTGSLRPYQERGFSWLAFLGQWGLGACLADDMGLGKTVQTLALLQRDREAGQMEPVLLVCPVSVMDNWRREAQKFTPGMSLLLHHGTQRDKTAALRKAVAAVGLVITSYGLLQRDSRALAAISWRGVILDEAQHIKNPGTRLAQAARALSAQYRVALSGTPVENNVGDLWSIMEFLNPGLLGSPTEFKKRFFVPIQSRQDSQAADCLRQITGPFILRRMKTDRSIIGDLPEKLEMKTYCPLTREQTTLYAAVLKDFQEKLDGVDGIQRKGLILALLTGLKQVCNHPALFLGDGSEHLGRSGKLLRLEDMLEEVMASGERALLFTQFAKMGAMLQQRLQERFGYEVPFLHGGVTKKKRDEMVVRFQDAGSNLPMMILSLKAGGTGLNLTAASHVFHFDRWWNPAVEDQASDRAFRIGQRRNVTVHKFICAGTVEDKIDEMIEAKKQVAGSVVSTGEAWLTELSNDALKDVFALRATAMED